MKITERQKMNNLKKVINALRSGEYRKTDGRLKRGDCFCAQGVFCDLLVKGKLAGSPKRAKWDKDVFRSPMGYSGAVAPSFYKDALLPIDSLVKVISYNDDGLRTLKGEYLESTFEDIADILEAEHVYKVLQ